MDDFYGEKNNKTKTTDGDGGEMEMGISTILHNPLTLNNF
jgi:hypothetical protein